MPQTRSSGERVGELELFQQGGVMTRIKIKKKQLNQFVLRPVGCARATNKAVADRPTVSQMVDVSWKHEI